MLGLKPTTSDLLLFLADGFKIEQTMITATLKPNNKPTRAGFYLVQRQRNKNLINSIVSARVIQNKYYNRGELYVFLGELSCFPLTHLEEDCLWSDEITIDKP